MMRTFILAAAAASLAIPTAPAMADPPRRYHNKNVYDSHGRYVEPRRLDRSDRIWRGRDGRYYCKRDNGTTGLVIGAAVGGLAGHEIAGRQDPGRDHRRGRRRSARQGNRSRRHEMPLTG